MRYLVVFLLWAPTAIAGPIYQYEFHVSATDGPLQGQGNTGRFTYRVPDQSTAIRYNPDIDAWLYGGLHFRDFSFHWGGRHYTEHTVQFGFVSLTTSGHLRPGQAGSAFGNKCFDGGCSLLLNIDNWEISFHNPAASSLPAMLFLYRTKEGGEGRGIGWIDFLGVKEVPEPSTLLLLAPLLLALGRWRLAGDRGRLARPLP